MKGGKESKELALAKEAAQSARDSLSKYRRTENGKRNETALKGIVVGGLAVKLGKMYMPKPDPKKPEDKDTRLRNTTLALAGLAVVAPGPVKKYQAELLYGTAFALGSLSQEQQWLDDNSPKPEASGVDGDASGWQERSGRRQDRRQNWRSAGEVASELEGLLSATSPDDAVSGSVDTSGLEAEGPAVTLAAKLADLARDLIQKGRKEEAAEAAAAGLLALDGYNITTDGQTVVDPETGRRERPRQELRLARRGLRDTRRASRVNRKLDKVEERQASFDAPAPASTPAPVAQQQPQVIYIPTPTGGEDYSDLDW